jgi:glycerate 2-kinase
MASAPVRERPVLVAPAAFAGAFRASEAAAHIGRGLERAGLMPPDLCPVADGGSGTLDVLLPALGGELVPADVHDPLGRPLVAQLALVEDGSTALLEPAAGLPLDADETSSHGTGELICAAVEAGAGVVVLAVGAEAARDGGEGALRAIAAHGGLGGARLVVLCDVRAAYAGGAGAAARLPRDPRGVPMTGAGGGLAGALWAAHGAVLEPGAAWVLAALGFDERMRAARAVVTGEGRLDEATLRGRVVGEIGTRTRQAGVPLHAVVGEDALDGFGRRLIDLQVVLAAHTADALEAAGERLGRALATGAA